MIRKLSHCVLLESSENLCELLACVPWNSYNDSLVKYFYSRLHPLGDGRPFYLVESWHTNQGPVVPVRSNIPIRHLRLFGRNRAIMMATSNPSFEKEWIVKGVDAPKPIGRCSSAHHCDAVPSHVSSFGPAAGQNEENQPSQMPSRAIAAL